LERFLIAHSLRMNRILLRGLCFQGGEDDLDLCLFLSVAEFQLARECQRLCQLEDVRVFSSSL
jgi:hypothetical protein